MYASQSIFVSAIPKCTKVWWQRKKNLWSVLACPPYCTKMSFGMTHDFQKISVVLRGLQKMKLVASIRGNCKKITSLAASNCTKFDKKEENTSMFRIARVEREIIMKMSMHTRLSDPTQLLKLSRLRLNTIRFRCKGKFKNLKFKKTKFVTWAAA